MLAPRRRSVRACPALALGVYAAFVAGCSDGTRLSDDAGTLGAGDARSDAAGDSGAPLDSGPAPDSSVIDGGGGDGGPLFDGGSTLDAAASCSSASECPGTDSECDTRTCEAATCGRFLSPSGTSLASQVSGDCRRLVCDGAGGSMPVADAGDLPDDENPCTVDLCTAGGPTTSPAPAGTPCGTGGVCDDAGSCIVP